MLFSTQAWLCTSTANKNALCILTAGGNTVQDKLDPVLTCSSGTSLCFLHRCFLERLILLCSALSLAEFFRGAAPVEKGGCSEGGPSHTAPLL